MDQDHVCIHERDWGSVSTNIENMCSQIDQIHKVLLGNGKEGLQAQIERAKTQTQIQWYFIGAILVAVVGGFIGHVAK